MTTPRLPAARRRPGHWVTSLGGHGNRRENLGDPSPNISWDVMQYFLGCHGLMVQMVPSCLVQMRGNGQPEFRLIPDLFHSGHVQWQALVNSRRTLIVGFS